MTESKAPGFATLAIHAGAQPDPATGARATPIYQTTSFVFDDVDHAASLFGLQAFGNIYTRIGNPTCAVLEERVAALEGGTAALAVASGHAAEFLVFHTLLQPGDEFIASKKLYGGSINQFNHSYKNFDWRVKWADPDDLSTFEAAICRQDEGDLHRIHRQSRRRHHRYPRHRRHRPQGGRAADRRQHDGDALPHQAVRARRRHHRAFRHQVPGRARQLHRRPHRRWRQFDWMKSGRYPMLSQPRPEYGGMVLGETFGNFGFAIACRVLGLRDLGPALSPFNAFMILTGIETLPLRMQRHSDNALVVARHLASSTPTVAWVSYPGARGRQVLRPGQALLAQGRGRGVHLRPQGRLRSGREAGVEPQAVLAPRQYRRHPLAGDPPGLHHPPPAHARAAGAGAARAPRSCACRSASRIPQDLIADLDEALATG